MHSVVTIWKFGVSLKGRHVFTINNKSLDIISSDLQLLLDGVKGDLLEFHRHAHERQQSHLRHVLLMRKACRVIRKDHWAQTSHSQLPCSRGVSPAIRLGAVRDSAQHKHLSVLSIFRVHPAGFNWISFCRQWKKYCWHKHSCTVSTQVKINSLGNKTLSYTGGRKMCHTDNCTQQCSYSFTCPSFCVYVCRDKSNNSKLLTKRINKIFVILVELNIGC